MVHRMGGFNPLRTGHGAQIYSEPYRMARLAPFSSGLTYFFFANTTSMP